MKKLRDGPTILIQVGSIGKSKKVSYKGWTQAKFFDRKILVEKKNCVEFVAISTEIVGKPKVTC